MSEDEFNKIFDSFEEEQKKLGYDEMTTEQAVIIGHFTSFIENSEFYHHDDKYRAVVKTAEQHIKLCSDLKAEVEKLREENERLKTAIAEAKIVQYAVEG